MVATNGRPDITAIAASSPLLGHASALGQVWTNSTATDFRDEIKAVVGQVRISGISDTQRVRETAQQTVDELFSLMKPPSTD